MGRDCGEGCEGRGGGIVDHEKKVTSPSPFVSSTQAKAALRPKQKRGERENKKGEEEEKQPSGLSSTSFSDLHARPLLLLLKQNEGTNTVVASLAPERSFFFLLLSLFPLLSSSVTISRRRRRIGYQPLPLPPRLASGATPAPPFSRQSVSPPQTLSLSLSYRAPTRGTPHREKRRFHRPFPPPQLSLSPPPALSILFS